MSGLITHGFDGENLRQEKSVNDQDNERFQWRGLTIPGFIVPTALFFA